MQGGYVSQSQGQQLNVTKKSNVLDKGKPNILNSAAKKLQNHSNESSNNNNNNSGADINDSASHKTSHHYEREPSPPAPAPPAPVVPEVTVSPINLKRTSKK